MISNDATKSNGNQSTVSARNRSDSVSRSYKDATAGAMISAGMVMINGGAMKKNSVAIASSQIVGEDQETIATTLIGNAGSSKCSSSELLNTVTDGNSNSAISSSDNGSWNSRDAWSAGVLNNATGNGDVRISFVCRTSVTTITVLPIIDTPGRGAIMRRISMERTYSGEP